MYYLAIVNLRDAFNNEKLKVRPCVVIKETKKHINVLTITHHFTPNRNAIPVVRNGKISYINVSAIMTCKKEYITKRLHKIDKKLEEKIKQELKVCSRKYCCSYENAHYKPDVYNESQEYLQEKVKSHDILNMYMRGKDTNGYKNSDIIENDKVYVEFVDNNGFKIRGTIKCVPRYLYHFKNGNVRKHPKFIDNLFNY